MNELMAFKIISSKKSKGENPNNMLVKEKEFSFQKKIPLKCYIPSGISKKWNRIKKSKLRAYLK